jgi:tRNA pseudouridine55 synthase
MYSALKFQGQPLYKLARQGKVVERAARTVEIHQLELLDFGPSTLRLRVECSKGTYIRTLIEQIASRWDTCAHVAALRRDFVEPFRAEPMYTIEQLQERIDAIPLLSADRAVAHLPALRLSLLQARAMSFGQSVTAAGADPGQLRLYDPAGRFLGLGMGTAGGAVRPVRLFATAAPGPL